MCDQATSSYRKSVDINQYNIHIIITDNNNKTKF